MLAVLVFAGIGEVVGDADAGPFAANAAQGVLEGFAAVRSHLVGLDYESPLPADAAVREYALSAVQLTWERRTPYAVVKRSAYSDSQRRTLHWVDLHMGPVTWQIVDRSGYDSVIPILRDAHRTAVAVCLDGGKYRADPTRDDYRSPETETPRTRRKGVRKSATARRATEPDGAQTTSLIGKAAHPGGLGAQPNVPISRPVPVLPVVDGGADLDY